MSNTIIIKVYNKESKLKLLVQETDTIKIVNLYKYDGENEDIHSFTYIKNPAGEKRFVKSNDGYVEVELKLISYQQSAQDRITYYDLLRRVDGIMIERMWVTNQQMEHWEVVGDMEEKKTTRLFESGNVYEERKKSINGEVYTTEFKNGKFSNFKFKIPEIKINEYLQMLSYGE